MHTMEKGRINDKELTLYLALKIMLMKPNTGYKTKDCMILIIHSHRMMTKESGNLGLNYGNLLLTICSIAKFLC